VECKLRSVNFRIVLDPRRAFRPVFTVAGILPDRYRGNCDLWWLINDYDGSDWDNFGSISEHQRVFSVYLGVSPNQRANHNQFLRDAWASMLSRLEDCRHYLRLLGCKWAIDFCQQWIWWMDYYSLWLPTHTSRHLLQHCILCIATLRKWTKKARDSNINAGTLKH
jgi:hypothetical protein